MMSTQSACMTSAGGVAWWSMASLHRALQMCQAVMLLITSHLCPSPSRETAEEKSGVGTTLINLSETCKAELPGKSSYPKAGPLSVAQATAPHDTIISPGEPAKTILRALCHTCCA